MFNTFLGSGRNDYTTCFFCDEILCQWDDDDEPWTEHAKWSKNCSYVLLNKGKHFVDQVCNVENDISNQLVIEYIYYFRNNIKNLTYTLFVGVIHIDK